VTSPFPSVGAATDVETVEWSEEDLERITGGYLKLMACDVLDALRFDESEEAK
jgi:hypothetical protein